MELPSTTFKMFFLKNDTASLERVKNQVQKYLNVSIKGILDLSRETLT